MRLTRFGSAQSIVRDVNRLLSVLDRCSTIVRLEFSHRISMFFFSFIVLPRSSRKLFVGSPFKLTWKFTTKQREKFALLRLKSIETRKRREILHRRELRSTDKVRRIFRDNFRFVKQTDFLGHEESIEKRVEKRRSEAKKDSSRFSFVPAENCWSNFLPCRRTIRFDFFPLSDNEVRRVCRTNSVSIWFDFLWDRVRSNELKTLKLELVEFGFSTNWEFSAPRDFSTSLFASAGCSINRDRSNNEDCGIDSAKFSSSIEKISVRWSKSKRWRTENRREKIDEFCSSSSKEKPTSIFERGQSETSRDFSCVNLFSSSARIELNLFESRRTVCKRVKLRRPVPETLNRSLFRRRNFRSEREKTDRLDFVELNLKNL